MRPRPLLALVLAPLLCAAPLRAQRQSIDLATGWRFIRRDVGPAAAPGAEWTEVALPHTWNAVDGANGLAADPGVPDGYYRGAGWYVRPLALPPAAAGRRVFARFEAVSIVADVFVNDRHAGQHRGAFTAFCCELTPFLRGDGTDVLRVRADNSRFQDVAPLQGDFTICGGIYRPAELLVTDAVCISPCDHGSRGVYLAVRRLSDAAAEVEVRTMADNGLPGEAAVEVEAEIADAGGQVVAAGRVPARIAGRATAPVAQTLRIAAPRRWNGRHDPFLYAVTVRLRRGGRTVDAVTQPLGLRTVALTDDRGFLLNGVPYPLYGVNRHQDREGRGWALTAADHAEDMALLDELGCTAVRLAHYPQCALVHDLADRSGLVVWEEIPLVDRISGLPQFADNAKEQLTEMILQDGNHPSSCFWGLFNELEAAWAEQPGPRPDALIAELRALAHRLDPSRPTVAASWKRDPDPLHAVPDAIAFNVYPGWYWGTPEDFTPLVERLIAPLGGRRIGISEYGAGASIFHHQEGAVAPPPDTATHFHPEEWQAALHERLWAQIRRNPHLWGTWVWTMADFAVDKRDEGDRPGRNDKGLVTRDRRVRKEAFYFYQANWSDRPMVHLAGRRPEARAQATTEIAVYSNCGEVELFLDGRSLGGQRPDAVHVARWPGVTLAAGANRVEVVARHAGGELRDGCTWSLLPVRPPLATGEVPALPVPADPRLPSLFLVGDSTVRTGTGEGEGGQWGWGSALGAHFAAAKINVVNRALGGRSSRTYLTQGHWERTLALVKPGDFVVMQFGHNDSSPVNEPTRARGTLPGVGEEMEAIDNLLTGQPELVRTYGWYLRTFIRATKARGATPVVCSLVPRKRWLDGRVVRSADTYAGWARQVAEQEGAAFVDLNERVARRYDALGAAAVNALFADENTHTTRAGAELNAECVVAGLRALPGDPFAAYLAEKSAAPSSSQP